MNGDLITKKTLEKPARICFRAGLGIFSAASMAIFTIIALLALLSPPVKGQTLQNSAQNGAGKNKPSTMTAVPQNPLPHPTYADIVSKVAPAVVTVRSERLVAAQQPDPTSDDLQRPNFGGGGGGGRDLPVKSSPLELERGLGSGVIISSNGIILTNNHVIEGASRLKVDLPDKRTFDVKVIGTDPATDLAVLKIEGENFPTLTVGDSDEMRIGDFVLAIGNPLGLDQTVTSGIISAKDRRTGILNGGFEDFLQTDAAINQGNSGGALVNLNGELVGINSELLSPSGGSVGLGFAISSNLAKSVMAQLLKDGKVHRGMLGVGTQNITSELANKFNLKEISGVLINSVEPNSPAELAGLRTGDVITAINGTKINDGNSMRNRIAQTAPGTEITVQYARDGVSLAAKVRLAELETSPNLPDPPGKTQDGGAAAKLGLSLQILTPQIASLIGAGSVMGGMVVTGVAVGGPADEAGLAEGDIILEINRQKVKTPEEVNQATAKSKDNSALLLVDRAGETIYVVVAM